MSSRGSELYAALAKIPDAVANVTGVVFALCYQRFSGVTFGHRLLDPSERRGSTLSVKMKPRIMDFFRTLTFQLVLDHPNSDVLPSILERMDKNPTVHGTVLDTASNQYTTQQAPYRSKTLFGQPFTRFTPGVLSVPAWGGGRRR